MSLYYYDFFIPILFNFSVFCNISVNIMALFSAQIITNDELTIKQIYHNVMSLYTELIVLHFLIWYIIQYLTNYSSLLYKFLLKAACDPWEQVVHICHKESTKFKQTLPKQQGKLIKDNDISL